LRGKRDTRPTIALTFRATRPPAIGYLRFTGWLCVVTGVAFLLVCGLGVAQRHVASAAVWFAAGSVLIAWGAWRLRSARR
jgi:hypothetical protein